MGLVAPNKPKKTITVGLVVEAVPADNADGVANASPGDVALLEAPTAHNNAGASLAEGDALSSREKETADADGAEEAASLSSEVEFDLQPVSI